MSVIVFKADSSNRGYVKATIAPAADSDSRGLSLIDLLLAASFLTCAGGLIWLVLGE